MCSSGLGEGKGTAAGERDTTEAEGETGGNRAGNSSGDMIRVNMGEGEGDEEVRTPRSGLISGATDE